MCEYVQDDTLIAGFICCQCRSYNGLQRHACRGCGTDRCKPLTPNTETGEKCETYEEAYRNDPETLRRINEQLAANAGN